MIKRVVILTYILLELHLFVRCIVGLLLDFVSECMPGHGLLDDE